MELEFMGLKLKGNSNWLIKLREIYNFIPQKDYNFLNKFIVIDEEVIGGKHFYKVQQLSNKGIRIIDKLDIGFTSTQIPVDEFDERFSEKVRVYVPKENLTKEIIDNANIFYRKVG